MTTTLGYRIEFRSPFRIATGDPGGGLDSRVDKDRPLPASTLKGLMRVAAERLVGSDHRLIAEVFGASGDAGQWRWKHGQVADLRAGVRSRIAIDVKSRTVAYETLQRAEFLEASEATFEIEFDGPVREPSADHIALLDAAAQSTLSLGSDRNRGFGWVHVTGKGRDIDNMQLAGQIIAMRNHQGGQHRANHGDKVGGSS